MNDARWVSRSQSLARGAGCRPPQVLDHLRNPEFQGRSLHLLAGSKEDLSPAAADLAGLIGHHLNTMASH